MHGEQGFLLIACAVDDPNELDITSLTVSDRTWMAHMFTYCLHDGTISPLCLILYVFVSLTQIPRDTWWQTVYYWLAY